MARLPKEERIRQIKDAIERGARSFKDIADSIGDGFSAGSVKVYTSLYHITVPGVSKPLKLEDTGLTATIRSIEDAVAQGYSSIDEIEARTGKSPQTIITYFGRGLIPLSDSSFKLTSLKELSKVFQVQVSGGKEPTKVLEDFLNDPELALRYRKTMENLQQIYGYLAEGVSTPRDVTSRTGLSTNIIRIYAQQFNIPFESKILSGKKLAKAIQDRIGKGDAKERVLEDLLKSTTSPRGQKILDYVQRIYTALSMGYATAKELAQETGLPPRTINKYAQNFNIPLKRKKSKVSREKLEKYVREGRTLTYMAEQFGVHKSRVSQRLDQLSLYDNWKMQRQKRVAAEQGRAQKKDNTHQLLLGTLAQRIEQLIKEEPWAQQKAFEYRHPLAPRWKTNIPYESLFKLFKAYHDAEQEGKKLSLYDFETVSGILFSHVGRILKKVGLEPMVLGSLERKATPSWKKEVIDRVINFHFSPGDVAHFLGLESYVVVQQWHRRVRTEQSKPIRGFLRLGPLTYSMASQIYEAADCGFSRDEIVELVGKKAQVVQYALNQREEIEPTIISLLQTLFPSREITTPYLEAPPTKNDARPPASRFGISSKIVQNAAEKAEQLKQAHPQTKVSYDQARAFFEHYMFTDELGTGTSVKDMAHSSGISPTTGYKLLRSVRL